MYKHDYVWLFNKYQTYVCMIMSEEDKVDILDMNDGNDRTDNER